MHTKKNYFPRLSHCPNSESGLFSGPPAKSCSDSQGIDINMGAAMQANSGSFPKWVRLCAWCGVLLPEPDGTLRERDPSAAITHGICPVCREAWVRDMKPDVVPAPPRAGVLGDIR
jgi:hypothetical protein